MFKTIGLFAHVDSGKTSLAEQILYETNAIRTKGRVDHQNTFLDHHSIEKQRGITVFTEQASFKYNGSIYYLLDTPGHIDFSSEMERAIKVLDYAIVIINGFEGVQSHTETIVDCLKQYHIPMVFFINKVDREGVDIERVLTQLRLNLGVNPIYLPNELDLSELPIEIIEQLAELNEDLLDYFLENKRDSQFWLTTFKQQIRMQNICPVFSGSALKNIGITSFLKQFDELTETTYDRTAPFKGSVYKIRYDEKGDRITYLKVLSGNLAVKDSIKTSATEEGEKVNQIRYYQGKKFETTPIAQAGELIGVTGLTHTMAGQIIGHEIKREEGLLQPVMRVSVLYPQSLNAKDVLAIFKKLEDEDPMLLVLWNEVTQSIDVSVMGSIQLEVLKEIIQERFDLSIEFSPRKVIYQETITNQVIGSGHYEPLKHYAEVHLQLEPGQRGSGVTFESVCSTEELELSHQKLIETHIFEKTHLGILTGSSLTDVHIKLITGRAHQKHTSGGDFREATYRAIRQGLEQAKNLLLEPYYTVKFEVEMDLMGRILTDLKKMSGKFDNPIVQENKCLITGTVPVATFMDYPSEFLSYTKGAGRISLNVAGYDICHNPEEVISEIAYDKAADRLNPSGSVFCAKGSGFIVPWDEVDEYMHCKVKKIATPYKK